MRSLVAWAFAAIFLTGCRAEEPKSPLLGEAKFRADMANRGVGRFQIVPATGKYPPLFLDTVTGCVSQLNFDIVTGELELLQLVHSEKTCSGDLPGDNVREAMERMEGQKK